MRDLFISHASVDAEVARQIVERLEAAGVTCWLAPRDIAPAADYRSEILRGLEECGALLFLQSRAALRSEHVVREVSLADEADKTILPLLIEPTPADGPLKYLLQGKQFVDFRKEPDAAIASVAAKFGHSGEGLSPFVWRLPAPRRARIVRNSLIGLGVIAVLGVGGYFANKAFAGMNAVARCDKLATSELEFGVEGGVPFGMIDPPRAIKACEAAVRARPNSAREVMQLYRAQRAKSRNAVSADVLIRAIELKHPEAFLWVFETIDIFGGRSVDPKIEAALGDEAAAVAKLTAAVDALLARDLANDPRATVLVTEYLTWISKVPFTGARAERLEQLAPWKSVSERYAAHMAVGIDDPDLQPDQRVRRQQLIDLGRQAPDWPHFIEAQSAQSGDTTELPVAIETALQTLLIRQAEQGSNTAKAYLVRATADAHSVEEERQITGGPTRADLLKELAAADDPGARLESARLTLLEAKKQDSIDGAQARSLREQAGRDIMALAEQGYRPAMIIVAQLELNHPPDSGLGSAQNTDSALRWLRRASGAQETP